MILISYGTRPEYIKIIPLINKLEENRLPYKILFTGQHETIGGKKWDYNLTIDNRTPNRLNNIINSCLSIPEEVFENVKIVIVQGDTTSALGVSIACMNRKIKLFHLEAGLRSHDKENPYPEEFNRKLISEIAHVHLCPTDGNKKNLNDENIFDNVFVVGNTGLDNLTSSQNEITYEKKILITLHRRENHEILEQWFTEIENLASKYYDYEFILPIHPNPEVSKFKEILNKVKVVEPFSYEEMINILKKVKIVITDSGGLQEECSFLNKKCLVCRKTTERQESLNHSSFLVKSPVDLEKEFEYHLKNYKICYKSPYGDGHSADKIVEIIKKYL